MADMGFRPSLIIDVGAADGTEDLYDAFPKGVPLLLIEPLQEFEPHLKAICRSHSAKYFIAAAGRCSGSVRLNVHPDLYGSSLFKEVEGAEVDGFEREVPMVTLDELVGHEVSAPILLKIDAQGAEIEILEGAREVLGRIEVVVLEALFYAAIIGAPQIARQIAYMDAQGFAVYDFINPLYRPIDGAMSQVDIVYVREKGFFRLNHAYATPEQRVTILALGHH
jgi:FkbM family methyltransferase